MMRSMYSGVAGLKTHQTKMDVIGNNIANVNTVAFKASTTTFSEIMYQNISGAAGPTTNNRGGINAKQIGLGVTTASTTINITNPGAVQTTGDGFDLAITGDSFFIVNNGAENLFTKAGAFYIDAAGNLAMKSTGYNVMGWQVDPATGAIRQDTVSPLRIMQDANLTSAPEPTIYGVCSGVLDKNSTSVNSDAGYAMNLNFFDALGYQYSAMFAVRSTDVKGEYTVELTDIIDSVGTSLKDIYGVQNLEDIVTFGSQNIQTVTSRYDTLQGVHYDPATGLYRKEVAFPETAANYDLTKISGFTYTENSVAGTTITADAKLALGYKQVEELYGVIYDTEDKTYYKGGEAIDTPAKWMEVMGIPADAIVAGSFVANQDGDGTMTFTFQQTFDAVENMQPEPSLGEGIYSIPISQAEAYGLVEDASKSYAYDVAPNGAAQITVSTIMSANVLKFDTDTGLFVNIGGQNSVMLDFKGNVTDLQGNNWALGNFSDIEVDFTGAKWFDNGGSSTLGMVNGNVDDPTVGTGKPLGTLIGLSVSQDGTIWGSYSNGNTHLLGQIAVAVFTNPSGLEKVGDNCYQTTLNSGDFDGIGQDVTADGGGMTSGVLEMSNVDLSTEFTEMITTQRGFQANSRIITTSDSLLEELINLKR